MFAASLLACANVPGLPGFGRRGPTDAERREYEAAIATARRDSAQGRARLTAFLARNPDSTLADDAVVPLARLERRAGRSEVAEKQLRTVLKAHPKENRADAARLELAKILAERGALDEASKVADAVRVSMLREDERRDAYRLLADLARERGDPAERLDWLARLRATLSEGGDVLAVDREIESTIGTLSLRELMQAGEKLGRRSPAAQVWLRAANLALRGGEMATATRALARAEKLPLTAAEKEQAARLQGALSAQSAAPSEQIAPPPLAAISGSDAGSAATADGVAVGAIGVVLPLSGPLARVAEDVLRGALLAAGSFAAPTPDGDAIRILVRDSGGDPVRATNAVRELGQRGDVSAVIGPLTKEEVEAAGVAAQETGLSLLALTRHEAVARDRAEVIRFGLTRRMEVEVLADHAVQARGLTRFAILYPKDEYGREFETLLWQAVEARGARVVAVAGYQPNATDFAPAIATLLGPHAEKPATPGVPAPETPAPPPLVDFDALFIPDAHDKVALIALQLASSQIHGVQLLGPSGWHHPDLLRVAGPAVEGAVFSSVFDPNNPAGVVQDFVARYQGAYATAPTSFAAQGFDAVNLIALQMRRGAQAPGDVRAGLATTELYPGVSGVTSIAADGDARKRPFLIEIRGGETISLE